MKIILKILLLITSLVFTSCFDDLQDVVDEVYYPEIVVRQGTQQLSSGGTQNIGSTGIGDSISITFSIENIGRRFLYLTGSPAVEISGADASMFSVVSQPTDSLAPFSYRTFNLTFSPTGLAGTKTATITIRSNDPSVGVFTVHLEGEGTVVTAPLINVRESGTDVVIGLTRSLGSADVGLSQDYTFTIFNNGNAPLTLSNPVITGIDSSMFVLETPPADLTIPATENRPFVIRFTPGSGGVKKAVISINNNDSARNPYYFNIEATGVVVPTPDIRVRQGAALLPSGTGEYDFGEINQGTTSSVVTFTIQNIGTAVLNPGIVTVTGTQFAILAQPAGTVNSMDSTTFTMTYTPTGAFATETVTIPSNDPDTSSYTFTVEGTGVAIPEIHIMQGAANISSGGSQTFGLTYLNVDVPLIFTIQNTGNGNLNLTSTPLVDITGSSYFIVTSDPAPIVGPGGNTTFEVTYNPSEAGTHNAVISIANNDLNENPYIINIDGTGDIVAAPKIDLRVNGDSINSGDTVDFGGMGVNAADPLEVTFTIHNTGNAVLDLSGGTSVSVGDFILSSGPAASVGIGGSTTCTVQFTATVSGSRSGTITINSNDTARSPIVINLTGTGMEPEINVRQGISDIASGATFDFGKVGTGASKDVVFKIENTGTDPLYLTGIPKVTGGSAQFSVLSQPSKTSIANGETATFVLRFTPGTTGSFNSSFTIASNDADENPYTINVTGEGVNSQINITPVVNGGNHPFGNHKIGTAATPVTFTIQNTGTTNLNLLGSPNVIISGADAGHFTVTQPLSSSISGSGSTTFTIAFTPAGIAGMGYKTATVSVYSDASNIPVYVFTVEGTGTTPEIQVSQGVTPINSGTTFNGFPDVNFGSAGAEIEFTISNSGGANLLLTGAPAVQITGTDAASFSVTQVPTLTDIPGGGGSATFRITFSPVAPAIPLGTRTATVTISNDDLDENSYTFTIEAECVDNEAPVITISSPVVDTPVKDAGQTLVFSATDNVTAAVSILFRARIGAGVMTAINSGDLISSIDGWATAGEGAITVEMEADDGVSNTGTASRNFIKDTVVPTVTSVLVPVDGNYTTGANLDFVVNFSENITVTGTDSTLGLTFNSGSVTALQFSTTATSITYRYTVLGGDTDPDGIVVGTVNLNTTTVRDAATNNANMTLNGIGSTANVRIDTTPPVVTSVSVPADGNYTTGANLDFVVNFSENITVTGTDSTLGLTFNSGSVTALQFSTTATSITYRYTVLGGDTDPDGIVVGTVNLNTTTVRDAATNNANMTLNGIGSTANVRIDTTPPVVTSVSVPADGNYTTGANLDFVVNFSENITVTGTDSTLGLTFNSGSVTALQFSTTATSITYRYTVLGGDTDPDGIVVGTVNLNTTTVRDAATNNANMTLNGVGSTAGVLVNN